MSIHLLVIEMPLRNQKLSGSGTPSDRQWKTAVSPSAASTDVGFLSQYGAAGRKRQNDQVKVTK